MSFNVFVFSQISGVWETLCSDAHLVTVILAELTAARMFSFCLYFVCDIIKSIE